MTDERKIRKPLMEKKRRARINDSLDILKSILMECDPEGASRGGHKSAKLEKADILEMTVSYLQKLRARQKQCISYPYGLVPNPAMLPYKTKYQPQSGITHQQIYQSPIKVVPLPQNILTYPIKNYQMNPVTYRNVPTRHLPVDLRNTTCQYVPHVEMVSPPVSPVIGCNKVTSSRDEKIDVQGDVWRPW